MLLKLSMCILLWSFTFISKAQKILSTPYSFLVIEKKTPKNSPTSDNQKDIDYSPLLLVKYTVTDTGYIAQTLHNYFYTNNMEFQNPSGDILEYNAELLKNSGNYYIFNKYCGVFDIKNKKVYRQLGRDNFIDILGDSIIYRHTSYISHDKIDTDTLKHNQIKTPYYYCDLGEDKIAPIYNDTIFHIKGNSIRLSMSKNYQRGILDTLGNLISDGVLSPDFKKLAYIVPYESNVKDRLCHKVASHYEGDLFLKLTNKDSVKILQNVICYTRMPVAKNFVANDCPIVWVNTNELVVQQDWGQLVHIKIDSMKIQKFPELPYTDDCGLPSPRLYYTTDKQLIYYCPTLHGDEFIVDIASNKLELKTLYNISKNYSVFSINNRSLKRLYYKGKEILNDSSYIMYMKDIKVGQDDMLVLYAVLHPSKKPAKHKYNGYTLLKIYNPKKGKWIDIEFDDSVYRPVDNVLGWIEE